MNSKFSLFIIGVLSVLGAMLAITWYLSGTFIDMVYIAGVSLPLILMLALKARPYWFIFIIGFNTFWNLPIKAVLFDALGGTTPIILMIIGGFCMADRAISRTRIVLRDSWVYRAMLILAWFIVIRFAVQPAGSARLGEIGGLSRSVPMLMCGWMFFVAYWVTRNTERFKTCFIWVLVSAFLGMFFSYFSKLAAQGSYLGHFYDWRMWLLIGAALAAISVYTKSKSIAGFWFMVIAVLALLLGLINPHRSRILFAVSSLLVWGFMTRRFVRVAALTLLLAAGPILLLFSIEGQQGVPTVFKRPLSLFMEVQSADTSLGEMGWVSDFRKDLYRLSWEEIKEQPILGNGFRFSRAELLQQVAMQNAKGFLAIGGAFHNSLLLLATTIGLPLTALFTLVYVFSLIQGLRWVRSHPNDRYRFIAMTILIYIIPASGQLLMNGSTKDILNICILLGILWAAMDRGDLEMARAEATAQKIPAPISPAHRIVALPTHH